MGTAWTVQQANEVLHLILQLVGIVGVPLSIIGYFVNEARRRKQERAALYVEINNKYLDFLALSLRHPELGVSESPVDQKPAPIGSDEDRIRQWSIFSYVASLTERAYYLTRMKGYPDKGEWDSWDRWIGAYVLNPNYRQYWEAITTNFTRKGPFGAAFEAYMRDKLKETVPLLRMPNPL
jgi:hypothetical protein